MEVTPVGIVTDCIALPLNALASMTSVASGTTADKRYPQPENAPDAIAAISGEKAIPVLP